MGDKIRAKLHVAASGVPIVPGVADPSLDDAGLVAAAESVGFPLLVKPSAGGGGKGMQVVRAADELAAALATARRVASAAFGDDTLLLERLIERPRHIEVQVLADAAGNVIHLGERECSLQRRHQKVIEEAPSPLLDEQTRERIGARGLRRRPQRRLPRRGHGRVPRLRCRARRVLLHRDEHPPAGRAPRDRARDGRRPGRTATPRRRGRAARVRAAAGAAPGACHRGSRLRRDAAPRVPPVDGAGRRLASTRGRRRARRRGHPRGPADHGVLRPDDRQGHHVRFRSCTGARTARPCARRHRRARRRHEHRLPPAPDRRARGAVGRTRHRAHRPHARGPRHRPCARTHRRGGTPVRAR